MRQHSIWLTGLASLYSMAPFAAQTPPAAAQKVEIVAITGCLKEQGANNWMLVNATDPAPSIANAPAKKDFPATPVIGKNQYKLIGVSEYDLPSHRDHTIIAKGLYIKATPVNRLNLTSIVTVIETCGGAPAKW